MKKVIVTEKNFNEILSKIQNICNKYKMFKFYRVFSEDMKEQKQYRRNPIGFRYETKEYIDSDGEWNYKRVRKFFSWNRYVRVTKHHFREAYEQNEDSYDGKYAYPRMKSLIHLDLSGSSALVISDGDKVQFLPFGGFIVWTDDNFTRFKNPLTIYKNIFIPDIINGKIENLEEENSIRDSEWEEEARWWNEQYEKDLEKEYEEEMRYEGLEEDMEGYDW